MKENWGLPDKAAIEMGGSPVRKEISHMLAGQTLYNKFMPADNELTILNIEAKLNNYGSIGRLRGQNKEPVRGSLQKN